jgi:hypothetical protein
MSDDQEWKYNADAPLMLSGRTFHELCINKNTINCHVTRDGKNNVVMEHGFNTTTFLAHDATVYLYLLHLCSTSKYTITSGYDVGEYLNFTTRVKGAYKECQKASGSIRRLKQAGYLVHLPSFHKGKFIPLRRIHDGKEYDSVSGFQYFCNSTDRIKAFESYGKAPKTVPSKAIVPVKASRNPASESPFGSDFEF